MVHYTHTEAEAPTKRLEQTLIKSLRPNNHPPPPPPQEYEAAAEALYKQMQSKHRPTTIALGQPNGGGWGRMGRGRAGKKKGTETDQKSATLKQNVKYTNNKTKMPSGVHLLGSNE